MRESPPPGPAEFPDAHGSVPPQVTEDGRGRAATDPAASAGPAGPPQAPPGPRSPVPGAAYHRVAATVPRRWWIAPLALLCAAVVWLAAVAVVMLLATMVSVVVPLLFGAEVSGDDTTIYGHPVADLTVQLLMLTLLIPAVYLVARVVQGRRPGTLSSVVGHLRWRWLLYCFGAGIPAVFLALGLPVVLWAVAGAEQRLTGDFVGVQTFVFAMVVIVALVPLQAAAEEYGLRGFVMQTAGSYTASPWLGIVVSTALFTMLHFSYTFWALADVALFGAAMAWLIWRTGGLEAGIALHVLHNLAAFTITAWDGTLMDLETAGSWQGTVTTLVELVVFCLIVVRLADRMGIRRTVSDSRPVARE
ncbi:CPBP family intramembrane glutamic endopeptidase [Lipingzhangella sp. LS1_29]|uniref:CPBP family intramembrane glutamic endopeptidase n=2 Tax=Lipingzhangella rawalii TaxID=2055835 RepID=A0ABU2H383_9ACTN|nr:CPBP family intramembrane glutamic endopeptidase [Lipingzhangella rawalii]